jgi:hypothetical protein
MVDKVLSSSFAVLEEPQLSFAANLNQSLEFSTFIFIPFLSPVEDLTGDQVIQFQFCLSDLSALISKSDDVSPLTQPKEG